MQLKLATALRETLKKGYTFSDFKHDALAGITVGIVALPLGMALGIASGVPPQYGLYTIVVAGFLVALLGGSQFQVTGPTAAFVVLLVPVVTKFGLAGLFVAGILAGFITLAMGLSGFGRMIQYVPHPVTSGFTSGIAVVIAAIQLKDFFGLKFDHVPESFFDRIYLLVTELPNFNWQELSIGIFTMMVLLSCIRFLKIIPAPIAAIVISTVFTKILHQLWTGFDPATIYSTFNTEVNGVLIQGIPPGLPGFIWPWAQSPDNSFGLSFHTIREILPSSFAIAMLGAIESLLSAVIADGMTRKKHDPDGELIALGIGNIIGPFFGGIPATGAIARTSTNVKFGAKSPVAACFHALVVAVVITFFAREISQVPMAALASLLLYVSYSIFDLHHFKNIFKLAQKDDKLVFITCFLLTIIFDMVIGVGVGVVLAFLVTIRRFSEMTQVLDKLETPMDGDEFPELQKEIFYYKIKGSLFFGASQKAMETMNQVDTKTRVVILDLSELTYMDLTGLVALDSALGTLKVGHRKVVIVVNDDKILEAIKKLDVILTSSNHFFFSNNLHSGVDRANILFSNKLNPSTKEL